MITYHLRTPFTLVRRTVRLSRHAASRRAASRHARPCRATPRNAMPHHATPPRTPRFASPCHVTSRHRTTPLPPYPPHPTTPCYRVDRTVPLPLPPRVGSSGCYAIDPTLRPTNFSLSLSSSVSLCLFRILFFSAKSVVHRSRPRAPVSHVLIATAAFPVVVSSTSEERRRRAP